MIPVIRKLQTKKLIGKQMLMSLVQNRTHELWQSFMQDRRKIKGAVSPDLFSLQVYNSTNYFLNFNPQNTFIKWAAIEVENFDNIPDAMECFTLEAGAYAVFNYKGNPALGNEVFEYIFGTWLTSSDYELNDRPHFEILGEKYKNNDPQSEEEIWIPVKPKGEIE